MPEKKEEILSEFVRFMMHCSAGIDIGESREKEAAFDKLMLQSKDSLQKLLPELDRKQIDMIQQHLEDKVDPNHIFEVPSIPKEYLDLVDQAYERYLLYQQNARKNLDNLLGSTFGLFFLCVLYLFSQPII